MAEYQRGPHTVHDIKYHFVWVTKYRKPILKGEVAVSVQPAFACMRKRAQESMQEISLEPIGLEANMTLCSQG